MTHGNQTWTAGDDARLMEFVSREFTFARIGELLGKSRNAATGRFDRLRKAMGPQAQ